MTDKICGFFDKTELDLRDDGDCRLAIVAMPLLVAYLRSSYAKCIDHSDVSTSSFLFCNSVIESSKEN